MAEPVSLQVLLNYLALISVPVGVLYHIMTLRNTRKNQEMQLETRQAQLFMPLYETYRNREFRRQMAELRNQKWTSNEDFIEKYGPDTNPDAFATRLAVGSYFDGIGVLVKNNLVDVNMVNDLIGNSIISVWEQFGPIFVDLRARISNPYVYTDWEYLYHEIVKHREEHPNPKI